MFVQSVHFIEEHRKDLKDGSGDVFVYGQEKTLETVKLLDQHWEHLRVRHPGRQRSLLEGILNAAHGREPENVLNPAPGRRHNPIFPDL